MRILGQYLPRYFEFVSQECSDSEYSIVLSPPLESEIFKRMGTVGLTIDTLFGT